MRTIAAIALVILSSLGIFLAVSLFSENYTAITQPRQNQKQKKAEQKSSTIRTLHAAAPAKRGQYIYQNWRNERGIPVLCYHQVVTADQYRQKPTPYAVTIDKFSTQMAWLKEQGFSTITLDQLQAYVTGQAEKPAGRPMVLTFDDGVKDFLMAEPVLNQYGFKATLFIYPTYIQAKKPRALTWPQVKQVAARGHEIHSHTLWHPFLNSMTEKEEEQQFRISKKLLNKYASAQARYLAYPFGIHSANSAGLLQEQGYRGAFTIFDGSNLPGQDPYFLNRYMIVYGNTMATFQSRVLSRALPIASLSPQRGTAITGPTSLSITLPAGLDPQGLSLKFGTTKLPFQYDSASGTLKSSLQPFDNRVRNLLIQYRENGKLYKATILYSRPRKKRS